MTIIGNKKVTHVLAHVEWYTSYLATNIYSDPVEILGNLFEPFLNVSFMPVGT
jgi:hypothetical protein